MRRFFTFHTDTLVLVAASTLGLSHAALAGTPIGTPGPIAGAGLPVVAVAAGYFWIRKKLKTRD